LEPLRRLTRYISKNCWFHNQIKKLLYKLLTN